MHSAKLKKDSKFVTNQLLAVDKNSQSIMEIQFGQATELDCRETMQAASQIIWTKTALN